MCERLTDVMRRPIVFISIFNFLFLSSIFIYLFCFKLQWHRYLLCNELDDCFRKFYFFVTIPKQKSKLERLNNVTLNSSRLCWNNNYIITEYFWLSWVLKNYLRVVSATKSRYVLLTFIFCFLWFFCLLFAYGIHMHHTNSMDLMFVLSVPNVEWWKHGLLSHYFSQVV